MAEYLKSYKWSEVKNMSEAEIASLPCIEVVNDDGSMLGNMGVFLMVPTTDFIRALMDSRGELSNALYVPPVKEPEIINEEKPLTPKRKYKKHRKKVKAI